MVIPGSNGYLSIKSIWVKANVWWSRRRAGFKVCCDTSTSNHALAKTPKRLHDAFYILAKKIMYADGEIAAKAAFSELEEAMKDDCQRAVECLRKDLNSLLSHYKFSRKLWRPLKTTNAVERIHKEFKRRARAMDGMTENTLSTLAAFTAMRLEMSWKRCAVDTYAAEELQRGSVPFIGEGSSSSDVMTLHWRQTRIA